jgi:uncharacterized protein
MSVNKSTGLQINVAQLLKDTTGAVRQVDVYDEVDHLDQDLTIVSPIRGKATLIRTADGILVTAQLKTAVQLDCSRCLEPFVREVELELEEEFEPSIDIHTGAKLPVTSTDEDATTIDEHHVLDLTEVVRQTIFLALPMNPACSSDCAGLCPVCGQNLNQGHCGCVIDHTDPRLEALRQLL